METNDLADLAWSPDGRVLCIWDSLLRVSTISNTHSTLRNLNQEFTYGKTVTNAMHMLWQLLHEFFRHRVCIYECVWGGGSGGRALWPPHHLVQCLSFKFGFLPLYLDPSVSCLPHPPPTILLDCGVPSPLLVTLPPPPLLLPLVTMTRSDFFDNWICLMWSTWLEMFLHNFLYF